MENKLLIIGASGHGKVVADAAFSMRKWNKIAFLDDKEDIQSFSGIPVIGKKVDAHKFLNEYQVFVAIGDNEIRKKIHNEMESLGASIPIIIHPYSVIGLEVEIGIGTVVMAGVVINSSTSIGKGCIINTGSTIDHDNSIDDFVHISPGSHLAGTVKIGKGSWLGIGCAVSNNIYITEKCKVGAGSVVIKDLTEPGVYVGIPAKKLDY